MLKFTLLINASAPGRLVDRSIQADKERRETQSFAEFRSLVDDATSNGWNFVAVEWWSREDSRYSFILAVAQGAEMQLSTTIIPILGPDDEVNVEEPDEIRIYNFSLDDIDTFVKEVPFTLSAQEGIGGDANFDDGNVFFFTRQSGSSALQFVLQGVSFVIFDETAQQPCDAQDRERHAVIDAVLQLWETLLLPDNATAIATRAIALPVP